LISSVFNTCKGRILLKCVILIFSIVSVND
jgi:hypothetical protein